MSPASPSTSQQPCPCPALSLYPLNGSFVSKRIPLLGGQRVKIGRQTNSRTRPGEKNGFFDTKVLSRQHAEIWGEDCKIYIKDLGSSNGTFVNGERLSPEGAVSNPSELKSGDIVEFGIDIVRDDGKTIIHHKVAAKAVCVFLEQGTQVAAQPKQDQDKRQLEYALSPRSSAGREGEGQGVDISNQELFQKEVTEMQQLMGQGDITFGDPLKALQLSSLSDDLLKHLHESAKADAGSGREKQEGGIPEEHEVQGTSGVDGSDDAETGRGKNNREAELQDSADIAKGMVWDLLSAILNDKAAYKILLDSTGQRAQAILDILQKSLDSEDVPEKLRVSALFATIRLCTASGVYPQCLALREIRYDNEPIASGSFGDIWKGYLGNQTVCLKVARVYATSEVENVIKGYTGEAILWSQLNHPNLLPFYGIYSLLDGRLGRVGLVSPWMQNGNVIEYLKANPEAPRTPLVHDILAGLGYLHEQQVVHGDLKGANILISPDGSACLADFGLSSVVDPDILRWTSLKTISKAGGTTRWEAPELMDELEDGTSPRPTFLSDVYSVASVMYEVLTGQIPYYEFSRDVTVISRIVRGIRPTRPTSGLAPELSDEIWNVMEGCWSTNPSKRPAVNQVAEQLRKVPQSELTARRIAGHHLQKRNEGDSEIEVLPPRLFRDAIRGYHPTFSEADVDLLREYQR